VREKVRTTGRPIRLPFLLVFLAFPTSPIFAQVSVKPDADSLYNAYMNFASLVRGGSVQAHWMEDGSSFWYAEGAPDSTIIYKVDPETNTRIVLIDPERVRRAVTPLLGHDPPNRGLPFETVEFMEDERAVKFTLEEKDFLLRLDTHEIDWTPVPEVNHAIPLEIPPRFPDWGATREMLSPDGRWLLSVRDENLWLRSAMNGHATQLTTDGVEDQGWSYAPWDGRIWSPDGSRIVARKTDFGQVPKIPIACFAEGWNDVRWMPYVTARAPQPKTELFVLGVEDGSRVSIDVGDSKDQLVRAQGWQADGSRIFFIRWNRPHTRVELLTADPATGASRVLLTEDKKIPSLLHSLRTTFFTPLGDGERFIWLSDRDGSSQLYLYHIDSGLIRTLTPDTLRAEFVVGVDETDGWIYWRGRTTDARADAHLYRVGLDGERLRRLTEGVGYHNIQFAPSKRFFIDSHNSTARPPSAELRSAEGDLLQVLSRADISGLLALGWAPPEEFVVKAADGRTDIFGAIYRSPDFDPEQKYPVLQYIYAAPGSDDAPRGFSPGWIAADQGRALSQLGFITVRMDWRGFRGWGTAQEPIYGNIGRYETADHVVALEQLAEERPYMDLGRVGIFGASYGGYTAIRAMLQAPDFYKIGVATMPITDMAEHWGNEYFLGLYEENREAYEYASNIPLAKNLAGKLLLIHGTCDTAVPFASHTLRFVGELARVGKPYDLIVLPGQGHGFTGSSEAYWLDAVRRYFVEHLNP
jgi:dipeptidyl aminopeptidase/acylaminoacyl peptidase